jgi:hypothetical protein
MTTLAGSLPKGGHNGLEAIRSQLVQHPQTAHLVVALVDCKKVTTDTDTGDTEPTARIRAIEVVDKANEERLSALLQRLYEERTGQPGALWDLATGTLYFDADTPADRGGPE